MEATTHTGAIDSSEAKEESSGAPTLDRDAVRLQDLPVQVLNAIYTQVPLLALLVLRQASKGNRRTVDGWLATEKTE
eukprot:1683981-Pyramimonas_sp.AAC.1